MNTNQLKKFAQEARIKLMEQVGAKLSFVLNADTVELREKVDQLKQLREELNRTNKPQLIEKVAYTWFNRLMALRFMDANDYQPMGIRVITPKDGYSLPELLDEAKRGNIPEELHVNKQRVYDLLDNRIPSSNPQNEAFKELLIASCNHLHNTFPFLFEKINDYTELLMPDDLTSDFSIVTQVIYGMPAEDCKNVEIIGWLYQFYISEKKDEVIGSKEKVKKEDIPAATQLFTPRWIVEYMVQNTVGKLWLQNHPKSRLREHMPYFIESASLAAEDYLKIGSPEEIRLLDPASGSGHILVYGFDLFTKMYEEQGYNNSDIPKLIIEKNLYGFEIDERASQLTALALMMKAREYQRRVFSKDITPNVVCFQDLSLTTGEIKETFRLVNIHVSDELIRDLNQIQQITNFGSLIIPHSHSTEIRQVDEKLKQLLPNADVFQKNKIDELISAIDQLKVLADKYHCVVTNPPYMSGVSMNDILSGWVKSNYPISKADLFSCFIERGIQFVPAFGYNGLVTMESWMFLSSFEQFRNNLINNTKIHCLSHFGWHIMRIAFGTVSFIIENSKSDDTFKGTYSYLEIEDIDKQTDRPKAFPKRDNGRYKIVNQKEFEKIPSSPIGYWLSERTLKIFKDSTTLETEGLVRQGASTSDNIRFLRFWHEISISKVGINLFGLEDANTSLYKWFPYNKGGDFRKWYGNHSYVINYENDGYELKEYQSNLNQGWTVRLKSREYYFKETLSWSKISSGEFSVRFYPQGFIFDVAGCCYFVYEKSKQPIILAFLNSSVSKDILKLFSPTINYEIEHIKKLPFIYSETINPILIIQLISISKSDWDKNEYSWEFNQNPIVSNNRENFISIEDTINYYKKLWENKFFKLHQIEEKLNGQFIEIYGLMDELSPNILLEEITILQDELDRKALTKLNKKLIRDPETHEVLNYNDIELPFIPQEMMAQFISYAVGCMFGRYSLDKEGLILANQGETVNDYEDKILNGRVYSEPIEGAANAFNVTFPKIRFYPDEDNIIPVLDNEWFEDDIVGRFYQFLKVTFGEKNFNKSLAFIEEQIGKDIRSYFIRDFYSDHIQRYKKRPIYWMFSSPKGSFNVLIYMHRYTPDTVSNILNKYLKEFIGKLQTRREHLQRVQISGSQLEKVKAIKETDTIDRMLIELQEYEREVLFPLATERISIDLDDGVLVNYNKFGKAVKEVSGLNDKKTKDKVREFDWIDTTQIR